VPQLRGMYHGDRSRKETLVEFGFRLPSALDNRPLRFEEFEKLVNQVIFVSATPGPYELARCGVRRIGESSPLVAEQIIRPTGLVDPPITVRPSKNQIDDLISRIQDRVRKKQRTLVITVSKHLAEEIAEYLKAFKIKVHYLHYEIDTLERVEILKGLREAKFEVLVGINLLREGLDLPEVSLVAILDADKEGFLRSETSLIQIAGRAARSVDGEVVMYADRITPAMEAAIRETERRRTLQMEYNRKHNITPKTVKKPIHQTLAEIIGSKKKDQEKLVREEEEFYGKDVARLIRILDKKMMAAAKRLDFEEAIYYRDKLKKLKEEK
ncbi:MAG: UvrB/UvrC motif-containing protein, partial [Candidatus Omnitrophica bacterium]|nr:UvrB/UvrC motif-containing protein [Candidatus Omnitrophota bacterium]